jgi:hypothetical protein
MPTNQRNHIEEIEDQHRLVMSAYCQLRDNPPDDDKNFKKELWRLIDEDPFFLDPYLDLAELVMDDGKRQEAYFIAREAYDRAMSLIGGKEGYWPKRIPWSWLENRHILGAINQYAHVGLGGG